MPGELTQTDFPAQGSSTVVHLIFLSLLVFAVSASAADATFFRGVNLNGPALTIDGNAWSAGTEAKVEGKTFENQKVPLKPATDEARAQMIRSSAWGDKVDIEFSAVPDGPYQIAVYVWEDNNNERFNVLVNGKTVAEDFDSGTAGYWKRLGPFPTRADRGKIVVSARAGSHGAANLSGVEIWSGEGAIPSLATAQFAGEPTSEQLEFFEKRIRPVLADNCYECHSAGAKKIKGGLVLDSRAGVRKGGDTGPAIAPGDTDASLLIQAVRHKSEDTAMPPKMKLPPEVIADLEKWVKMGAPDPRSTDTVAVVQAKSAIDWAKASEWWSLKPLSQPAPPPVQNTGWPTSELDRFLLARMEAAGLPPAADADANVLIRRVTFDLTGLPPTHEEVDAFVDKRESYAQLVDRLLASPAYGERWGRLWLDVVRYADTAGDNSDFPIPQMHRYRDWVIGAFNRDLPYDQFVREQLAGDLLGGEGDERFQRIIATGYIANARRFGSRVSDYPQHLTIEDTIDNVGRAFLGLTINCARCHDHKFDPITAQDYYALYGIFKSTRYPWPGIELEQRQRDLIPLVATEKLAAAEAGKKAHEGEQRRLIKALDKLKEGLKSVSEKQPQEDKLKAAEQALADHEKTRPKIDTAYGVSEGAKREDAALQTKGDPAKPGERVKRRFLTVLGGAEVYSQESGRRELANWITAKENPLAARVIVNRIWQGHFGTGLVPTPNDFGKQGRKPSHPELLDWLASRFIEDGWSIKKLHRHILLSHVYRISGIRTDDALLKDPANELLSAFPRKRLDAESIRDTLLTLGNSLDRSPAGPHPFPPENKWKFTQHNPFKEVYESNRRSVYLMTQRIQRHPFLSIFDGADPSTSTPSRLTSTTPLQALYLLNSPLVHEQSQRFATRIAASASDDRTRISNAYMLALSRPAKSEETDAAVRFLAEVPDAERWNALARVIFRLNEFIYLD